MRPPFLLSITLLARRAISTGSPLFQYDPNTAKDCVEWYNNGEGDTCKNVRKFFGITPEEFAAWNPSLNLDCEPWHPSVSYCIVTETKLNATNPTTTPLSTVPSSTTSTTITAPSPTVWTSLGCYVEDPDMPILEQNMSPDGDSSFTIAECEDTCYRGAFGFAGVQNGNECWCGSYVGGNWASDQASCDESCTGDEYAMCGGSGFLNVFKVEENQEAVSTTGSTTSTGTGSENASDIPSATAVVSSAAANKLGVMMSEDFWGLRNTF
jgi:hypothetical protein